MWILIVIASAGFGDSGYGITSVEMTSREKCIKAVEFSKKRSRVYDAYCVEK